MLLNGRGAARSEGRRAGTHRGPQLAAAVVLGALCLGTQAPAEDTATPQVVAPEAAAGADDGLPVQPGYWDTHLSALLLSGRDRRCVHASEVARFVGGPQNHVYTCRYPTSVVADGHLTWIGACDSRGGSHVELNATGTYTRTTLTAHGRVRTHVLGLPVSAPFSIRATRLGDCSQFPSAPIVNRGH